MDIENLDYDPKIIARYVHFHKTGEDIDNPNSKDTAAAAALPPKKKQKKKNIPPAVLETRRTIQLCCRDNNLPLALRTFHTAMRDLVRMEAQVLYQLLNLCEGTFAERTGAHVGTPKNPKKGDKAGEDEKGGGGEENASREDAKSTITTNISLERRLHHAKQIHALLSSLNIPLIDQAFTALIRLASRAGDFDRAEKYLDEAEKTQQCKIKLRIYSSLLRAYCGDVAVSGADDADEKSQHTAVPTREGLIRALKVWKRMHDNSGGMSTGHPNYSNAKKEGADKGTLFGEGISPKVTLTECEYTALMSCATALHDVPVMERVLSDVADQVLIPGSSTTEAMLNWFRSDVGDSAIAKADSGHQAASSALDHVILPPREDPTLGSVTNVNGKGWNVYPSCSIEAATGKLTLSAPKGDVNNEGCSAKAQYRLKTVELTERAWNAMREMNSSIVLEGQVEGHVSQYQGGGKGKKRPRGGNGSIGNNQNNERHNIHHNNKKKTESKINAWKGFETYIKEHPPFNVVIDGANVGYFEQNFANAPRHIDYKQIDWMLRHLLEQPHSASNDQHHIILFLHERHFSPKLAPHWADSIIQSWDGNTPPYNRLSVYRTPAGMNDDWFWMHAALMNGGKEDAPSVLSISNDEMRDHHFQMHAEGSFLRWKERHQVKFDFGPWNRDLRRREALLQYPNIYSRRIQRVVCDDGADGGDAFVIPLPKKGDEGRFADGLHVADAGVPEEETYIVIQRVI